MVTQEGKSMDYIENKDLQNYMMMTLRSSTLIGYFKDINQQAMLGLAQQVLGFILGFYDLNQFLQNFSLNLKKSMDQEFFTNFEKNVLEFLEIHFKKHPPLLYDFKNKCILIKKKLGLIKIVKDFIPDKNLFLKQLLKWIE